MGAGDGSGTAMAQMAYIAQQRGDHADAEKFYRRAIETDEKLAGTMKVNLAGLLINADERLDEAEKLLEEAWSKGTAPERAECISTWPCFT